MIDEQKHPCTQTLKRRSGGGQPTLCCRKLLHLAAVEGFDQCFARREVAIERGGAEPGCARDAVKAGRGAIPSEGLFRDLKDPLAVAFRIRLVRGALIDLRTASAGCQAVNLNDSRGLPQGE